MSNDHPSFERGDRPALTASHWGPGLVETRDGRIVAVKGHKDDPVPSPLNDNIAGSLNGSARIRRPAVRASWLRGEQGERGRDPFVEVSWDRVLDLIAGEITRVKAAYGNEGIYAGSYGWSSAGRFHHAQSQLKRFLNTQGGFIRSEGNYSYNAAMGLMPYLVGNFRQHVAQATRWTVIRDHSDLVVMFGGLAARNSQVSDGGISQHRVPGDLAACARNGVTFVNVSPLQNDVSEELSPEWLPPRPGTDTALMMGLTHTLLSEGLHNQDFLDRYTVGFDKVSDYLTGVDDGCAKSAEWAAKICGVEADTIRTLARRMAAGRTMITTAAALQRADWGEQPLWMTIVLASVLGQIGLPGGGFTIGSGVNGNIAAMERPFRWGTIPQGDNPVQDFIPVALIADMLLTPGGSYAYHGETRVLPDPKLVWWAGGNPFHHHQNLNKLHRAFQRPETVIVNEIGWTATARHADIVLPVAAPQERMDFCGGKSDNALIPMPAHVAPQGEARVEFDIYADLAERLGRREDFTEGRTAKEWVAEIWNKTRESGAASNVDLPDFKTFLNGDVIELPDPSPNQVFLQEYRDDPVANPLPTPSGKIELFSQTIADFALSDCPGHPYWAPPRDTVAEDAFEHPLSLISGQPKTRLHSQQDDGAYSKSRKIGGREPAFLHPNEAAKRGIAQGDIIELFNRRGSCLAAASLSEAVAEGVVFLWTGAWYDPDYSMRQNRDRHGNPNVLTHDLRTSSLTQSTAAHSCRIEVVKWAGSAPRVRAHEPPAFVSED